MPKSLMKGNEALAKGAILGGCTHFFGYPITPQNEIPEFLARELPKTGGIFLQAESEIAAINMVYGAAAAGGRPMTSSSSPGIALMQEGISLLAAAELPSVIVNVQRGGPGIGTIQPSQCDYFQMTRGGGNGDYSIIALAPSTAQESAEMMIDAFELAQRYRTPVFIVSDGMLGQMMEPVTMPSKVPQQSVKKDWAAVGHDNRRPPITIKTLALDPCDLEQINLRLQEKFMRIRESESRYETYRISEAELIFCGYGSVGRILKNSVDQLRHEGVRVGLLRVKTLWPFPVEAFNVLPPRCRHILSTEMNCGQMIDDVRLAVNGKIQVTHYGRPGGIIPTPEELADHAKNILAGGCQ
ncbi:3-methyl-2-oxobutanoate dehydrogenase subunit VorB [Desulforhopalus singaporensis]|uniref:2-oxoglutarate ferredoxin oxidoreductase subunit alpha n=1 Tax=Desulforhopalus singaporensis TaxID=91360 RepID=A0A1H0L978_9BACT|nr:3-methyl-2-oxobutanoate dehydrogenase subunit VorB [Desulforhopalus singaporensis]SDO64784.1 2-oxoglutarate ferredoxin oxidoreductase subunit alpha [Desulforhopalus singaporensis]